MTFFSNSLNVPVPGARLAPYYIYGFNCTLNGTTPNTKLDLGVGACSDSTDTIDMVLSTAVVINTAVVGAGGIDTGTLGASSFYYIHVIGDSSGFNQPTAMISLSKTAPIMPYGYDSFRVVDIKKTDGSSHFVVSYTEGAYGDRMFWYDAPVTVYSGAGTGGSTFVSHSIADAVPPLAISNVQFVVVLTPNTAGNIVYLRPTGSAAANGIALMSAAVKSVVQVNDLNCESFVAGGVSSIDYRTDEAADTITMSVKSFTYNV